MSSLDQLVLKLQHLGRSEVVTTKARRFGIVANNALGIYQSDIKILAQGIGYDDALAVQLFDTGIYEAKLLCSKIYNVNSLTASQMDEWVKTFENWEICDSFCMGLFAQSRFAILKALEWVESDAEFVKRAGFVIMATYGFSHKNEGNEIFQQFFPILLREGKDGRSYVSKAIDWALRQIGKRNQDLRNEAISVAQQLLCGDKNSQRVGKNVLRELESPSVKMLNYPRGIYGERI
jgi:3-methyladenine DNA glycosylase AlkD